MIKDMNGLIETAITGIRKATDIAIVGLSGGADSTLVACLCVKALGKENVYGVHMPYGDTDKNTFNSRSEKLSEKLGIQSFMIPIHSIADAIVQTTQEGIKVDMLNPVNRGNARSRARMCTLYSVAHEMAYDKEGKKVRVVGTGNLSEDFIGYDTKGGDALCDFFPIGELFKSEVYQLLEHFRDTGIITEELIDRHPSAGLWEGQTDEGELGHSYNEMEQSIRKLRQSVDGEIEVCDELAETNLDKFVLNRHHANKHKHMAPPVLELRDYCD